MNSVTYDLRKLFERAHGYSEQIREGDQRKLAELNQEVDAKKLGGRLVVLEMPDELLNPAWANTRHSHLFPSGRLGGFALRYCDDALEPDLVTVMHDVRAAFGSTHLATVSGLEVPYDVALEQMDADLSREVRALLTSVDFSFPKLALLCAKSNTDNLDMSLFITALNDFRLPRQLASRIYTFTCQTYFFTRGKDVGPAEKYIAGYSVGNGDMFSLLSPKRSVNPLLHITSMIPGTPQAEFRDILIDYDVVGHDAA